MRPELVQLSLYRLYFFEGGINSDQIKENFINFLFVKFAILFSWGKQITNLYLFLQFFSKALDSLDLTLYFKIPFGQTSQGCIYFTYLMGIEILHKLLEIVANFQICDHFTYFSKFLITLLLQTGMFHKFFLDVFNICINILLFSCLFCKLHLNIANFLFSVKFVLIYFFPCGQVVLDTISELTELGICLDYLHFNFLFQLERFRLQPINSLRIDVIFNQGLFKFCGKFRLCLFDYISDKLLVYSIVEFSFAVINLPQGFRLDLSEFFLVFIDAYLQGLAHGSVFLCLIFFQLLQLVLKSSESLLQIVFALSICNIDSLFKLPCFIKKDFEYIRNLSYLQPQFVPCIFNGIFLVFKLAPGRDLFEKSGIDIDICVDECKRVGHYTFRGAQLNFLFHFLYIFFLRLGLEVQFLDAILEFVIVDFKLDARNAGDVDHLVVHPVMSNKINNQISI